MLMNKIHHNTYLIYILKHYHKVKQTNILYSHKVTFFFFFNCDFTVTYFDLVSRAAFTIEDTDVRSSVFSFRIQLKLNI